MNAVRSIFFTLFFLFLLSGLALASSTGMPWESPMSTVLNSMTGTVSRVCGTIAIVIFGISVSFSGEGTAIRKGLWVLLGLSIAFSAASWGLPFLGFGGGILI